MRVPDTSEGERSANEISIRNYYFDYNNGSYRNNIVFAGRYRWSKALTLTANFSLSSRYKNGEHSYGTGDSYIDAVYTLSRTERIAFGVGGGMVLPTASSDHLGSGKLQLAPIVRLTYHGLNDRLIAALQLRNFVSVATVSQSNFISIEGDSLFFESNTSQINFLEIKPSLRYALSERWEFYTEPLLMTVNWANNRDMSYRTSFRVIRMLTHKLGVWLQPEFPFGSNRTGDFNLKAALFFAF